MAGVGSKAATERVKGVNEEAGKKHEGMSEEGVQKGAKATRGKVTRFLRWFRWRRWRRRRRWRRSIVKKKCRCKGIKSPKVV